MKTRQIALIAVMACNDSRTKIPSFLPAAPKGKKPSTALPNRLHIYQFDSLLLPFLPPQASAKNETGEEEEEKRKNARPTTVYQFNSFVALSALECIWIIFYR